MSSETRHEIKERCLTHMIECLANAERFTEPYAHFWAQGILPEDIYDRVLDELPESALYTHGAEGGKHYGNRIDMPLVSKTMDQLPAHSQELWYGIRQTLSDPRLKPAIFQNLATGMAHRFDVPEEEVGDIEAYPRAILYRETQGYTIAPHTDTSRKVATIQIALTNDPSQHDLGTSIYQLSANPKHLLSVPRGFEEVGRRPFLRNSIFSFAVVNTMKMRSWHGRGELRADCGVRNTLLHIYYRDQKDANPEMLDDFVTQKKAA